FYRRAADNLESYVRSRGFNRITREPKTGVIHSVLSTQHPAWFEMVDGTPIWICIVRGDDTTIKVHKWVSTGNEVLEDLHVAPDLYVEVDWKSPVTGKRARSISADLERWWQKYVASHPAQLPLSNKGQQQKAAELLKGLDKKP